MDGGEKIKSQYCAFLYIVLFRRRVFWITVFAIQLASGARFQADLTLLQPRLSGGEKDKNNSASIVFVNKKRTRLLRICIHCLKQFKVTNHTNSRAFLFKDQNFMRESFSRCPTDSVPRIRNSRPTEVQLLCPGDLRCLYSGRTAAQ